METDGSPRALFRFGLFEADIARGTLTRNGVRVRIQDQPFRVLVLLLERPGEIVTRAELKQKLWTEGTYVDFDGSLNVILKKLRAVIDDDPDNPRFVETVPRHGYRFIAPVTVVGAAMPIAVNAPADVSVSAPHVAAPVLNFPAASTSPVTEGAASVSGAAVPEIAAKPRPNHWYVISVLMMVVVALGLGFAWYRTGRTGKYLKAKAASQVSMRRSVAVLGFQNLSGRVNEAWLGTAFSEMLSTELSGGGKLRLVSGEDVANLRMSSPWAKADTLDRETTERIGDALNSDFLVLGSYAAVGERDRGQLRFDVRLQDAKSGEILTEIAEIGGTDDLFQIVSRVGEKLRDRLGVPRLELADETGVLSSMPHDSEAARFYVMGISKLRQFDVSAAKDLLEQAITVDPKFPLAHMMLARAWTGLGYEQKRQEEAKRARELSGKLPTSDRMLVEGDYYESLGNHEKAASVYHALFELFPDNVEYGLQFAYAEAAAGHGSEALEVIHQLRSLPAPASSDPQIDIAEARFSVSKVDSVKLIRQALTKAWSKGETLLYARARRDECMYLNYSDHAEDAEAPCQEAYRIFISAGNRLAAADSLRLLGDNQGTRGQFEGALVSYNRALQVLDGIGGEHEKTGAILNNMAIVYENQGQLDKSEELYRNAKNHFEQAGDKRNALTALGNLADVSYLRGDLGMAAKLYEQGLLASAKLEPNRPGYLLYRSADLALTQGRVRDARRLVNDAIESISQEKGNYQGLTSAMVVLGEVLEAEGKLDAAQDEFEKTLQIQKKTGMADLADEAQEELAEIDLLRGHAENAEPVLRSVIADFEKEHADPDATSAYTLLSRVLLAKGKAEEAEKAIQRAAELNGKGTDPALTLPLSIQRARVDAAVESRGYSNSLAQSRRALRATVANAKRLGYYNLEGEGRVALAELEIKTAPVPARAQLSSLATEAHSRGLELLAHRAEQVLNQQRGSEVAVYDPKR